VRVYRLNAVGTEVERLHHKYKGSKGVWDQIEQFERLLSNDQTQGHSRISNLHLKRGNIPASIWKARVLHPQLGGKRSGLRYVYERFAVDGEEYAVALTIYVHQDDKNESQIRSLIQKRFSEVEATAEGLRRLESVNFGK